MPLATASARAADGRALHTAYLGYLRSTGRGNTAYWTAARSFFARWPDPYAWADEPLEVKLSANGATRPLITFLTLHARLQPGYAYLLERKFSSLWRELQDTPIRADLDRFLPAQPRTGAGPLAFADRLEDVAPPIRAALVAYLERKRATCVPKTVSSLASRLMHFGVFLTQADPALSSIADLDRCRHIEPYLAALVD